MQPVAAANDVLENRTKELEKTKPKQAQSAWIYFLNANRQAEGEKIREQEKDTAEMSAKAVNGQVMVTLGEQWKAISVEKKKPFEELATKDKERFASEIEPWRKIEATLKGEKHAMEMYVEKQHTQRALSFYEEHLKNMAIEETKAAEAKKGKGKKGKGDSNKPKRGTSAFFFFSHENRSRVREENPEISMPEVSKLLGAEWTAMKDKKKAPFEKKAKEDEQRYASEMEVYQQEQVETQRIEAERLIEQHEKDLAEAMKMASAQEKQDMLLKRGKDSVKIEKETIKEAKKAENLVKKEKRQVEKSKPKAARTPYMLFCNHHRAEVTTENTGLKMIEVNQLLASMWKTVDDAVKQPFVKEAEGDKLRHHEEMGAWLREQSKDQMA